MRVHTLHTLYSLKLCLLIHAAVFSNVVSHCLPAADAFSPPKERLPQRRNALKGGRLNRGERLGQLPASGKDSGSSERLSQLPVARAFPCSWELLKAFPAACPPPEPFTDMGSYTQLCGCSLLSCSYTYTTHCSQ